MVTNKYTRLVSHIASPLFQPAMMLRFSISLLDSFPSLFCVQSAYSTLGDGVLLIYS